MLIYPPAPSHRSNEQALQRYNDMVAREAAAATPSNQTALSANVTAAVTNATTHGFRQVLKIMSQSSSFVTCARLYSLNWCVLGLADSCHALVGLD